MRLVPAFAAFAVLCICRSRGARRSSRRRFTHEGVFPPRRGRHRRYLHARPPPSTPPTRPPTAAPAISASRSAAPSARTWSSTARSGAWPRPAPTLPVRLGDHHPQQPVALNYGGIGPGLGYFFMPYNVFFGVALDFTRLGITNSNGDSTNSDVGLALNFTLGKQFWISDHWGLGVGLAQRGSAAATRTNNNDNNTATFKTFTGAGRADA